MASTSQKQSSSQGTTKFANANLNAAFAAKPTAQTQQGFVANKSGLLVLKVRRSPGIEMMNTIYALYGCTEVASALGYFAMIDLSSSCASRFRSVHALLLVASFQFPSL